MRRTRPALDPLVDAALDGDRVAACGDVPEAFFDDRLCENGCCCGSVAGDVVGFGCDLFAELRAHVLIAVFELDLFGDCDAVLGDRGGAPLLVDYNVAAFGAECDFDRVCDLVDASLESAACFFIKFKEFACHGFLWAPT